MRSLPVELGARSYSVHVGVGAVKRALELIPDMGDAERIALIRDRGAPEMLSRAVHATLVLDVGGEAHKTVGSAAEAWNRLTSGGFHRGDLVVGLGGGATTDLAGFVAATFMRGIAWVAVPTTLLAMVDAAIGGKTAIDLAAGKNLVGAFHQPLGVLADIAALGTLPPEQFATGMAEVIKHALIADTGLLELIERAKHDIDARDEASLESLVCAAAAVKVAIVQEDETERGVRAFLNYGHTLGHAIEALDGFSGHTHGQAVGIGMMFAAHLAAALGKADRVREHRSLLELYGLPTRGAGHDLDAVRSVWTRDKKYDRGVRFVLLDDIGKPTIVGDIPEDAMRAAYEAVR